MTALGCSEGDDDQGEGSGAASGNLDPGIGSGGNSTSGGTTGDGGNSTASGGSGAGSGSTSSNSTGGNSTIAVDGGDAGGLVDLSNDQLSAIQEDECNGVTREAETVPAVLQLVVDISLSMDDQSPGGGGTKWDVTQAALLDALDNIPGSVAVGLQLYPNMAVALGSDNPGCVSEDGQVPIAPLERPGSDQRAALADQINAVELLLGTPTHDAYTFALEESLKTYQGAGNRFMLLITDGAPTQLLGCGVLNGDQAVDTDPIIATVTEAASEGIRTFAIGSPGSEEGRAGDMREWLSHAALIGGTALEGCSLRGPDFCHFDMSQAENFSLALAEGLGAITAQVSNSCTFSVPEEGLDGEAVAKDATSVIVQWGDGTASLVQRDSDGSCSQGWDWNDSDEIVLCDATCAGVTADPLAAVTVSLDCDTEAIEDVIK